MYFNVAAFLIARVSSMEAAKFVLDVRLFNQYALIFTQTYACFDTSKNSINLMVSTEASWCSPISPLLAEIFMSTFENKLFSKNPVINSIYFWVRYVDDII